MKAEQLASSEKAFWNCAGDVAFAERHANEQGHEEAPGRTPAKGGDPTDPHERAHAEDINRRFPGRGVTTGQIIPFGLAGGLIPCLAVVKVLLFVSSSSNLRVASRWCQPASSRRSVSSTRKSAGPVLRLVAAYMSVSGWIGLVPHGE